MPVRHYFYASYFGFQFENISCFNITFISILIVLFGTFTLNLIKQISLTRLKLS